MNKWKIQSKVNFLELLSVDENELDTILEEKKKAYYNSHYKNKKDGQRLIYSMKPSSKLYLMQKQLQSKFFCNIYFPNCVYGFIKSKCYIDFLTPHCSMFKTKYFLRLDIKNFFYFLSVEDVRECFENYIEQDCKAEEHDYIQKKLIEITTYKEQFVQGAVTSPTISNLVFRKCDIRIEKYCETLNVTYTRYADDLLFSSNKNIIHSSRFIRAIQTIIKDRNFKINTNKTIKAKNEISLGGYVISDHVRFSRKKMKNINKLIYDMNSKSQTQLTKEEKYTLRNQFAGYRALLIQMYKYTTDDYEKKKLSSKINTIEDIISKKF